jgi:parvulin-like peptidyl-prolyl isomerase
VTREDFEELVNAINPKMTKLERRQLAENYGHMLALSQEAHRRGIDRQPGVRALLNYAHMTTLAGAFSKDLYREAANPSAKEIEEYYEGNRGFFTKYSFLRIYIPRERQGAQAASSQNLEQDLAATKSASVDEMKALADEVHTRAVAGEDFAALQERVFNVAAIKSPAEVKMDFEPGQLPKTQNAAFDLAAGAVSAVLPDDSGFYIYKLISKRTPELKNIREEVSMRMQTETTNQALKKIESYAKTKVNEDYFNKYQPPAPNPNEPDVDDD